jgi:hypothetical protein
MANPHVQSIAQSKEESIRKVIEFNRLSYPLEENTETNEEYYALSSPEKLGKEGQYFRFRSFPTNGENDGDDHDFKDYDKFSNKAAMEMKIKLIQNEEESPNGARLVMGKNRISTYCNIPNVVSWWFSIIYIGKESFFKIFICIGVLNLLSCHSRGVGSLVLLGAQVDLWQSKVTLKLHFHLDIKSFLVMHYYVIGILRMDGARYVILVEKETYHINLSLEILV